MSAFDFPDNSPIADSRGMVLPGWVQWIARIHRIALSEIQAGTTANRPVSGLWIGRRYMDTTLGKPVFVKSLGPTVWVDGAGTVA